MGGAGADPHHHESAMQQLLSDISAAAGTNEVLGFGVGSVNTQRNRGDMKYSLQWVWFGWAWCNGKGVCGI